MFLISIMFALVCLICSIFININWINDIACYFGYFLAIYLVTFIALIPGFNYVFTFISLLFSKKDKTSCSKKEEDVSLTVGKENVPANKYDGNAENTRNIIREVLSRPSKVATEWFNTNPYNEYMGISVEEYAYYRGVSYYSRFLNEGRISAEFAAQAKSDLTFAYNKKDNSNLLMRTRLYLGAVNLFAYNNLYEADKMFAEVASSLTEDDRYYSTVIYWRSRIGVASETDRNNFINILSSKPANTQILDYSSTRFKDLSSMPSYRENITNINAVNNAKPLYAPPKSTAKSGSTKTEEVLK